MRMFSQAAFRKEYILFCIQLFYIRHFESVDMNCKPLLIRV